MLLSAYTYSQSEEDYKNSLDLIQKAFNEKKAFSIYEKFSLDLKTQFKEFDFNKMTDSLFTEKGKISSFDFIMDEEKGKNYLVEFENSSMLMLLSLSPNGQISSLEIKEY